MRPARKTSGRPDAMRTTALRGPVLSFSGDPFQLGLEATLRYDSDAIVAIADGRITQVGPARKLRPLLPRGTASRSTARIRSSWRASSTATSTSRRRRSSAPAASSSSTGSRSTPSSPSSASTIAATRAKSRGFPRGEPAQRRDHVGRALHGASCSRSTRCSRKRGKLGLRTIAGKVLMDRNAPPKLLDTGANRLRAVESADRAAGTARDRLFVRDHAAFRSDEHAGTARGRRRRSARAFPDCFVQSHIAENRREVAWVRELFPERKSYLDVYDHYGLLGARTIYGHGIWLSERELRRCHDTGTAIAHCPTSNFFLGSGYLDLAQYR